jgi:hypothetical protein
MGGDDNYISRLQKKALSLNLLKINIIARFLSSGYQGAIYSNAIGNL